MKTVFIDVEFTGEHQFATLVSVGLATLEGGTLGVTFSDFDRDQVTPWLEENVLRYIDSQQAVPQVEGLRRIVDWLDAYGGGERISLVSAGKMLDLILFFQLWHTAFPERPYFHHLHCLPQYLNHAAHFDLPTIFFLSGVDPNSDREAFIGHALEGVRHEALYDALVVRECFLKCMNRSNFPRLPVELAEFAPTNPAGE